MRMEWSFIDPVNLDGTIQSTFFLSSLRGRVTDGINISNCSSASLSSTRAVSKRSSHVFFTIAVPDPSTDSLRVVILSNSMCW